jgi:hypothetical protein
MLNKLIINNGLVWTVTLNESQEVIWNFVAKHRAYPKVVVKDAIDNTVIEVENGKVLWPKLTEAERAALFDNLGISV